MWDSNQLSPNNSLYKLASVSGVLLGAFLLAGAYGHFAAVWPEVNDGIGSARRIALLFPGTVLLVTGLANIGSCMALWTGKRWPLLPGLALNALAMVYLGYLLYQDVAPDHPIGIFLALVASYVLLLGAITAGLTWPATGTNSTTGSS